jgi:hypothetical protein
MLSSNKWRDTFKYSKIKVLSLAACLCVAFLLLSGSALAGITKGHYPGDNPYSGSLTLPTYAIQAGGIGKVYTLTTTVQSASFTRQIQAPRQAPSGLPNSDFYLKIDLDPTIGVGVGIPQTGFSFAAGGLPKVTDITLVLPAGAAGAIGTVAIYDGGQAGDQYVRYYIPVTTTFAPNGSGQWPYVVITPNPWKITDGNGYLTGAKNVVKYMYVTATTYDVYNSLQFDDIATEGTDTAAILQTGNGVVGAVAREGARVIDLATTRKNFVPCSFFSPCESGSGNTTTVDATPRLNLQPASNVLGLNGNLYSFGAEITFTLSFTTNLNGILSTTWDPNDGTNTRSSAPGIPGTITITNTPILETGYGSSVPIYITVDGVTPLVSRVLLVTITYTSNNPGNSGDTVDSNDPLTAWTYNGSVLISNFGNGNTNAWRTRFYFWNYDEDPSSILVRVFTLPTDGSQSQLLPVANPQQLVFSNNIMANSGLTVRLEDILNQLGVPLPFTTWGGNLYIEFSFGSPEVVGWTQTFDPSATHFMGMIQMYP